MPGAGNTAVVTNLAQFVNEGLQYTDTISGTSGPQDITNWGLTFVVHAYGDPNTVYITKTVGSGIALTTPLAGVATVTIAAADVAGMLPNEYEWLMYRTDDSSNRVISRGLFTLMRR